MLTFTTAQLNLWIASLIFPLTRVLGLFAFAPAFSNLGMPMQIRLLFGVVVTLAIIPALPPMPEIAVGSWISLLMVVQEGMIGVLFGIALRIAFAAIDFAGSLVGLQMGLSFAAFYDPQNSGQTPVITEFFTLVALLIFLGMNGHLFTLALLAETFQVLPVSTVFIASKGFSALLASASTIFSMGLFLSLPIIAALLVTNIGLGVLARVSPQLNIFAVGFPVTMLVGFFVLLLSLPYLGVAIERLLDQGFITSMAIMKASAAIP